MALGTPDELRREGVGGEPIELVLEGGPADIAGRLRAAENLATSVEVQGEGDDDPRSRVRMLVDDAEAALPEVLASLDGIRVRSAGVPKVSFDEVFFRLMKTAARGRPWRGPSGTAPDPRAGSRPRRPRFLGVAAFPPWASTRDVADA